MILLVSGATTTGSLTTTGAISAGSLTATGTISAANLTVSGSTSLNNLSIAGCFSIPGTVSIGCNRIEPGYSLAVNGGIITTGLVVQYYNNWPDFIFSKTYKLKSLAETEEYIKANKHLEGVPTETEVKEKGIDVAEMNTILLKKIEEMTLLMIEQNKRIEALEKKGK